MSNDKNKPIRTLRDGNIKASIWKNDGGEKGAFYSVQFIRSYTDAQGNWHDSDSFSGSEILKLQHLAARSYDMIAELKAGDRQAQQAA